jgi:ketosteroid isomerase-like protein
MQAIVTAPAIELTWNVRKVNRFLQQYIDPRSNSGLLSVTPMLKFRLTTHARRNRCLSTCLIVPFVLCSALSLGAMPRGERHETRHEIDHLEDHWRDAILSHNVAAMDALLADDYMAITANGMLQSKDETLANMRSGALQLISIEFSDRKVRFYGTTALVTSRAEVSGAGPEGDLTGNYRYTRVYARDAKGQWRIVSFEVSKIRDDDEHK